MHVYIYIYISLERPCCGLFDLSAVSQEIDVQILDFEVRLEIPEIVVNPCALCF